MVCNLLEVMVYLQRRKRVNMKVSFNKGYYGIEGPRLFSFGVRVKQNFGFIFIFYKWYFDLEFKFSKSKRG